MLPAASPLQARLIRRYDVDAAFCCLIISIFLFRCRHDTSCYTLRMPAAVTPPRYHILYNMPLPMPLITRYWIVVAATLMR